MLWNGINCSVDECAFVKERMRQRLLLQLLLLLLQLLLLLMSTHQGGYDAHVQQLLQGVSQD